jgi:asparagine synthase (glutamine-hydrolysing)
MRLICGVLMLDGSAVPAERLPLMCEALQSPIRRARQAIWHSGPVGLGILEFNLSAPEPEVEQGSAGNICAADVRLDQSDELARALNLSSDTDAAICSGALGAWGSDAPLRMLGDFALAHWNPSTSELILARDAMGVRPLVYHHQPGRYLIFASFPQAIHASGLLPRQLNIDALAHQLLSQPRADETFSQGVLALPPGHMLHVTRAAAKLVCYWRPSLIRRRHRTPENAAEELRELVTAAVTSRVRGSGPVASHLSGGLDSSAIAVLASRILKPQGRTLLGYSFIPSLASAFDDERPFVEAVLAQEPEIVWKQIPESPFDGRWHAAMHLDRALSLDESDPENAVCSDAASQGANIVLSGWGGDEGITFNGRGALADAFLGLRLRYLAREIKALKRQRGFTTRGIFFGDVLTPMLPEILVDRLQRARGRTRSQPIDPLSLFAPALRERLMSEAGKSLRIGPSVRRNQLRLLSATHLAQRATNWALIGARYGLAFGFPLLDRRVVEFALSLPASWHLREGWKRRPFRDAMQGILPPLIQWRHGKLTPFPNSMLQMTQRKMPLLERVQTLSNHEFMHQIFDTGQMKMLVESLPDEQKLRNGVTPEAALPMMLISGAMQYASYVEQHF